MIKNSLKTKIKHVPSPAKHMTKWRVTTHNLAFKDSTRDYVAKLFIASTILNIIVVNLINIRFSKFTQKKNRILSFLPNKNLLLGIVN